MLRERLSQLASRALAKVWRAQRIPVVLDRSPGPRREWPSLAPDFEVAQGPSEVRVSCDVPGATRDNVLVCWDESLSILCIRVARATVGGVPHDWYLELPLSPTVDGAESKCTLLGENVRLHLPLSDTPASTGLALLTVPEHHRPFAGVPLLGSALATARA